MDENNNAMDVRIHDYISNLQFSISPTAFFQVGMAIIVLHWFQQYIFFLEYAILSLLLLQVNTLAAEKLYSLAGDWACLGPDTLLFDICCGTGTIGLTLAHRVGMVIISI